MLNYNSPRELSRVLNRIGVRLQKRWGQNFLVNRGAREAIVSLVEPDPGDTVWEIGAGLGTLTVLLLPRVRSLVAFEIDRGLIRYLNETFGVQESFRVVAGDVMKSWRSCWSERGTPDKIVGNLPYSSASAVIGALAENRVLPRRLVFTVQRELAERLTAEPGSKSYSSFSVLCQVAYSVSQRMQLKPGSFFPSPRIHSSVLVLEPNREVEHIREWAFFLRCLRVLFGSRRKTMRNNLLASGIAVPARGKRAGTPTARAARAEAVDRAFGELGIDPSLRSESLSPSQLLRLSLRLAVDLQDL